jgi:hypothetical protein
MLNFGQIREKYDDITGSTISTGKLAGYIDEAQIEIAKRYGKRVSIWYPTAETTLSAGVDADSVIIPVVDVLLLPEAPDSVYLGLGADAELISYTATVGNTLTGVTRGENDIEEAWPAGTPVTLEPEAGTEYDLPEDCLIVHEVRDVDNVHAFDYQITAENKISFFASSHFKMIYTKIPDLIDKDDNDAVPEVSPLFHPAIVKYCVAQHWEDIAEGIPGEENKATKLMAQFYGMVEDAAKHLKRNPNQQHQIGIKLW